MAAPGKDVLQWMPVIGPILTIVVGPYIYWWLTRKDRARQADHTEEVDNAKLLMEVVETYKTKALAVAAELEQADKDATHWQGEYWRAMSERTSFEGATAKEIATIREEAMAKVAKAQSEKVEAEAAKLKALQQIDYLQRQMEIVYSALERSRGGVISDEERRRIYTSRITASLNKPLMERRSSDVEKALEEEAGLDPQNGDPI